MEVYKSRTPCFCVKHCEPYNMCRYIAIIYLGQTDFNVFYDNPALQLAMLIVQFHAS